MSTRYKGSLLSSTAATSSSTAAGGIWRQSEVAQLVTAAWPSNDPSWSSVAMLLHGDGTGGTQNNTFIDSSGNNFTVTRIGATTQGSVNPFGSTAPYETTVEGGSGYFNGTSDLLSLSQATAFSLGTGDFTLEAWVYPTANPVSFYGIIDARPTPQPVLWAAGLRLISGNLKIEFFNGTQIDGSITVPLNTWTHVAFSRSGTTLKGFVNGVTDINTTMSTNLNTTGTQYIGGINDPTYNTGYLSNVRLVKGTALYTANFTPPTAPLTAVSGTSLLLNFNNAKVIDNSMKNNLVTAGSAQISNAYKYGTGAIYFNGTNSYLLSGNTTTGAFGANNFTIEFWLLVNALPSVSAQLYDTRPASTNGVYTLIYLSSNGTIRLYVSSADRITSTAISTGTWYHVAVCKSSGSTRMFINGVQSGSTYTDANTYISSSSFIGASYSGGPTISNFLNGFIDDFRITKGVARYTTTFTPPQQAFPDQ